MVPHQGPAPVQVEPRLMVMPISRDTTTAMYMTPVNSPSRLIGLTWMPEQQVIGLHKHPLRNGYVESVRAIPSRSCSWARRIVCFRISP